MNIQAMMKQAQKMQKDMMNAKEEIDNTTFEGKSSLVTVQMKGTKELTKEEQHTWKYNEAEAAGAGNFIEEGHTLIQYLFGA